ncbi:MAG: hypothetical protein JXA96_05565, partial [Sedimentisphaerales bacterium]|nr:hypothetical protein [Sedimentisphaerales bacterium]
DESDSVEHLTSFPGNYAVTRSQFTQEYRIQDTENSIENNEDCCAGLQSPCNDMENENDLKKQSQFFKTQTGNS